jgi:hypothetical protein
VTEEAMRYFSIAGVTGLMTIILPMEPKSVTKKLFNDNWHPDRVETKVTE